MATLAPVSAGAFLFVGMRKALDCSVMTDWDPFFGFERIRRATFHVEARWEGGGWHGTAFYLAGFNRSKRAVLATAKHVISVPQDRLVTWKLRQFSEQDEVTREWVYSTHGGSSRHQGITTHNQNDFGLLTLPPESDDGMMKFEIPPADVVPVPPEHLLKSEGTRVYWAGFPDLADAICPGVPKLCMYEGMISAVYNREGLHKYLVDGNLRMGVSGGPLWCYEPKYKRIEVIGIASAYVHAQEEPSDSAKWQPAIPGLALFEPINELLMLLREWNETANAMKQG